MLTYLLIAFVVTLAIMPLVHFLPSKRQRAVARLREYAAVNGLFVEFRQLPGRRPERVAGPDVIYYGLRLPPSGAAEPATQCWLREGEGWRALGARGAPPALLESLPDDVVAARADSVSCGVYWRESGDEQQVEQIRQALLRWADELLGAPRLRPG